MKIFLFIPKSNIDLVEEISRRKIKYLLFIIFIILIGKTLGWGVGFIRTLQKLPLESLEVPNN